MHFITWFFWKFYFYHTGCNTGISLRKTQATFHPFVAHVQSNDNLKIFSMCIINDCLTHDKVTVASFQRLVIPYLTSQYPNIKKIIYFSDGSLAQYKNKKNFLNLCHHKDDFKLNAECLFLPPLMTKTHMMPLEVQLKGKLTKSACNVLTRIR